MRQTSHPNSVARWLVWDAHGTGARLAGGMAAFGAFAVGRGDVLFLGTPAALVLAAMAYLAVAWLVSTTTSTREGASAASKVAVEIWRDTADARRQWLHMAAVALAAAAVEVVLRVTEFWSAYQAYRRRWGATNPKNAAIVEQALNFISNTANPHCAEHGDAVFDKVLKHYS